MDRVGGHAPDKIFPWTSPTMPRYNGVRLRPEWKSWVTEIQIPNTKRRLWLGSYPTAEMAARAYDAAVVCLKGPSDPKLNFPNSLISPDVVQSCTDLEGVKAIAKAAAYAIDSSSVPALQAARTPDSDYTHDRTPLVTPPELECSIGRRSSLIDEDFIFNHGDLILFDSVQGIDDHIHNAGEGFFNIDEIRPHPHGAEEDDHLWEWGLLAMNETFGNPFGPSWASSDGVLGLGKGKY